MSVGTATADAHSPDTPSSHANESVDGSVDSGNLAMSQPRRASTTFPPPKTDKPRPHVCQNCGRAFARLEHLKRHERSHTKEKPFECPECARCFARRDLLLRHQQKLHSAQNTTKPRGNRRESVSTTASTTNRVRKGSIATSVGTSHSTTAARPRANTLAHLDMSSLAPYGRNSNQAMSAHPHRASFAATQRPSSMGYHGMSSHHSLKLDSNNLRQSVEPPLQTAPPYSGGNPFDFDSLFPPDDNGSTVNPAQLHFGAAAANQQMPQLDAMMQASGQQNQNEDDFTWMRNWSLGQIHQLAENDYAIDEPSPPEIDVDSNMSMMPPPIDGLIDAAAIDMNANWIDLDVQSLMNPSAATLNLFNQSLPKVDPSLKVPSPHILQDSPAPDGFFNPPFPQMSSPGSYGAPINAASTSNFDSASPSMASSGSARQSSVTSNSTSSITETVRQALIFSLSKPSGFGHNHRKYSQPSISSPLSIGTRPGSNLPSTIDLQRYVSAYIQYFNPHLPFLHIPTLSFDSADYLSNIQSSTMHSSYGPSGMVGGGGCLILAMAAIGALYEFEFGPSKELFDSGKRMIQLYLEERRKADMSAAVNGHNSGSSSTNTPLWLVQAMLLNVIYGHHCSDKQSADIASTHCAALVSLARAADLTQPPSSKPLETNLMNVDGSSPAQDSPQNQTTSSPSWTQWKDVEERKRTLFAVFIVSSLLVTAYNHAPAIMNSEILLDLPCEEGLWSAESASDWMARGGSQSDENSSLPFPTALSNLLTANTRSSGSFVSGWQSNSHTNNSMNSNGHHVEMRPSTFGCFVLINALHNFIWETRSRHHSRQWTAKETEAMISHIEPALNAWQAAWKANGHHHIQRPNPYGLGPLPADSIPLLDLAFVRLYVDSGRSKEALWQRDFELMCTEFSRGADVANHNEGSPDSMPGAAANGNHQGVRRPSQILTTGQGSKREKYLRRAAFYAADSLSISTKMSLTYADASAHELPIQSALCFFDCGQVLAEWAATVQERVGRYLGVLGREDIDFSQVPAIMLLETEDIELMNKLETICQMMEEKLVRQNNAALFTSEFPMVDPSTGLAQQQDHVPALRGIGYGAKILKAIRLMYDKPGAWPVLNIMSTALEVQADHMTRRAEASLTAYS